MEKLPKAYSKYGAQMGRDSDPIVRLGMCQSKVSLARVPLDSGGYDSGGAYWGIGRPLYRAQGYEGDGELVQAFFRADSREAAKAKLPKTVRFFR